MVHTLVVKCVEADKKRGVHSPGGRRASCEREGVPREQNLGVTSTQLSITTVWFHPSANAPLSTLYALCSSSRVLLPVLFLPAAGFSDSIQLRSIL